MDTLTKASSLLHRYQVARFRSIGPFANPHRGQGRVLSILRLKPQISQKELGYLLDIRNQSLGELLAKLERRGLITRIRSDEDRRTSVINLTAAGRAAASDETTDEVDNDALFAGLTVEQQGQLRTYLDVVNAALEERLPEGGPNQPRRRPQPEA
jgi:DNA-binding MarR family transcriptional regulator